MNRFRHLPVSAGFDPQGLTRSDIRVLEDRSLRELGAHVVPRERRYQQELDEQRRAESEPNMEPNMLWGDELECFRSILKHPETIARRCERLGWDRDQELRARTGLQRKGLLRVGGTIGNKRKIYEPTKKGMEWAQEHSEERASYKSGSAHEAVLREVKRGMATSMSGVVFHDKGYAGALGGIQVDTVALIPARQGPTEQTGQTGEVKTVAIQICDCNSATYEAERLCQLCNLRAVDLVLSISVTRATREKVEKAIRKQAGEEWPAKLVLEDVERCLRARYDWNRVLAEHDESYAERLGGY